jgi:hypothetical protein
VQLIDRNYQFSIIDTCNFRMPLNSETVNFSCLSQPETTTDSITHEIKKISGKLKNLLVSIDSDSLTVCGSLAKYYCGNNLNLLRPKQLQIVVVELSDILDIDLLSAKITRLDTAFDIETEYKVKSYFPLFGFAKGMTRNFNGRDSLYYNGSFKSYCFYDKKKKLSKGINPFAVNDVENLMRFEKRDNTTAISKIIDKFGLKELTLGDLISKDKIYCELVRSLQGAYESIEKKREFLPAFKHNSTPKDLVEILAAEDVCDKGFSEIRNRIENARRQDILDYPEYYSRMLAKLKSLSNNKSYTIPDPTIEVLNSQIRTITKYSLAMRNSSMG